MQPIMAGRAGEALSPGSGKDFYNVPFRCLALKDYAMNIRTELCPSDKKPLAVKDSLLGIIQVKLWSRTTAR